MRASGWWMALIVLAAGCGEVYSVRESAKKSNQAKSEARGFDDSAAVSMPESRKVSARDLDGIADLAGGGGGMGGVQLSDKGGDAQLPAGLERKIVYTAKVQVAVEDFSGLPERVAKMAQSFGGYVAESEVHGRPGTPRRGEWTLRVPVGEYDKFLAAIKELGEIVSQRSESDEVTEEFYDLEARIRNKKAEEARVLKHLDVDTKDLEQILAVERELSRIRGEIESMEGRLRLLDNLTALSTVELTVLEIKNYEPPAPEAATFGERVSRSFERSLADIRDSGQNLAVSAAYTGPWLVAWAPGIALAIVPLLYVVRRRKAQKGASKT